MLEVKNMTLSQVLTALSNNINTNITLIDTENNPLITFNAPGYAGVDATLTAKIVKSISISSAQAVNITIADA